MRAFTRFPAPEFLEKHWETWGIKYANRKNDNPAYVFAWKTFNKQKINHLILPILKEQTQERCSYCDFFPLRLNDRTIDHFKPKGIPAFYQYVYQWENLYACCGHCQQARGENYDDALLRPDEPDYSFDRYFIFKVATGEILPRPNATDVERQRAAVSIRFWKMNDTEQCKARLIFWEFYRSKQPGDLTDFAFRFLFE